MRIGFKCYGISLNGSYSFVLNLSRDEIEEIISLYIQELSVTELASIMSRRGGEAKN